MVPAQGWHALIEKVSTFFLSPGSHVFFTLVSSSCFPDQHICADIPITHRWQVAGCSDPLKYWFQKTTIWFMLLACFPEHIHVESCVEKKSNQRFLKLQFLYFIGMEAWRLYSSHNFVKTWPVSKETGLFYVNITLCKPKKHTWFPCSSNILVIRICVMLRLNCTTTQLTQMSPNIPYSQDFWTFEHIGHP